MGIVGSLPTENNHLTVSNDSQLQSSPDQISHAHVCMKELQLTAARLEHRRKSDNEKTIKHRQKNRTLKIRNPNIQEQLKKQVEELELQQTRLLTTVTQLHRYREELQVVYQQIHSNDTS
jgi:hypothetical protein